MGNYCFFVEPGAYIVRFGLPSNLAFTTQGAGGDPEEDSDPDPVTGMSSPVTVGPGETRLDIDSGYILNCVGASAFSILLPACGLTADPVLTAPPPLPGSVWNLSMTSQFTGALVIVFVQIGAPVPTVVTVPGGTCNVWVDLTTLYPFVYDVTDAAGSWSAAIPLPADPSLYGLELTFQARVCDPTQPGPIFGFPDWLSTGLYVGIGCP
jgi:hypothetical protein